MKTLQVTIEALRERLRNARQEDAGSELMAFVELVAHPDAEWNDVITALSRWMLAESAALQFYMRFHVPRQGVEVEKDPQVWKDYLKAHDVRLSDKIGVSVVKH